MANSYFYPSSLVPSGGEFCDKTAPIPFSWVWNTDYTSYTISWVRIYIYNSVGAEVYYQQISGNVTSYDLPADTLTAYGFCSWKINVRFNSETIESGYELFRVQEEPPVANPISPKFAYINGEIETDFIWSHSISTGTPATKSELQYSTDGENWNDLVTIIGDTLSTTIAANTFLTGKLYWRVRTYNSDGIAGNWSSAAECYVVSPMPNPTITSHTPGTARPAFAWMAAVQSAFELEIDQGGVTVYKSAPVISTAKEYTITDYLPDGNYTARLRVYNDEGDVSAWASYTFTVVTVKPGVPTLTGAQINKGVSLSVTDIPDNCTVYILRDGVPVAKASSHKDYTTAAEHSYVARAIDANGCYADSVAVLIGPALKGSFISPVSNPGNVVSLLLNRDERPTREYTWSPQGAATFYAGRTHPVYEYSDQRTETGSYSRSFRTRAEFDGFMSVVGRGGTMLYRDRDGTAMWCAVTGLSWAFNRFTYDVSFSLLRVSYKEGITYD